MNMPMCLLFLLLQTASLLNRLSRLLYRVHVLSCRAFGRFLRGRASPWMVIGAVRRIHAPPVCPAQRKGPTKGRIFIGAVRRIPAPPVYPPSGCLRARGVVGRYGARHRMFIPPYLVLRIQFPLSTGRRRPACFSPGWTSRRNRIFHGLRSTRPIVALLLPDGRRVTGPVGPGEDPAGFIVPGLSYGRFGPG